MRYINKSFGIPKTLAFLEAKQENGDILFIARTTSLMTSYGDTQRDIASLKKDIIAIYIAKDKTLYKSERHFIQGILDCIEYSYNQKVEIASNDITIQIELYFATTDCDCCTCDIKEGFEKCDPPCCNCIRKHR